MARKLSPAMEIVLKACPFSYTSWGNQNLGGIPDGATLATVNALEDRGLIIVRRVPGGFQREVIATVQPKVTK